MYIAPHEETAVRDSRPWSARSESAHTHDNGQAGSSAVQTLCCWSRKQGLGVPLQPARTAKMRQSVQIQVAESRGRRLLYRRDARRECGRDLGSRRTIMTGEDPRGQVRGERSKQCKWSCRSKRTVTQTDDENWSRGAARVQGQLLRYPQPTPLCTPPEDAFRPATLCSAAHTLCTRLHSLFLRPRPTGHRSCIAGPLVCSAQPAT